MSNTNFQTADEMFDCWYDGLMSGTPPVLYQVGDGDLSRFEIGPGLVTLIGGPPGAGKTAFAMQAVVDALRLNLELRVAVCNVEMSPSTLLNRQMARLSGIDGTTIRYRRLSSQHAERIEAGVATIRSIASRLMFLRPPYDLDNIANAADAFGADVIVLDYIQRIKPPGEHGDKRGSVDATMSYLRQFADADTAVMVLSAVGRSKDNRGRSSYSGEGLNLASFRESSELEFGADDAFILTPAEGSNDQTTLRHLKSRNGECRDIHLTFNKPLQRFTSSGATTDPSIHSISISSRIAQMWDSVGPAEDCVEAS